MANAQMFDLIVYDKIDKRTIEKRARFVRDRHTRKHERQKKILQLNHNFFVVSMKGQKYMELHITKTTIGKVTWALLVDRTMT